MVKDLASQKESHFLERHLKPNSVHVLISIPPKYSVAQAIVFLKGKSALNCAGISEKEKELYRTTFLGQGGILYRSLGWMNRRSGSI
jgi:REP element-mobilizing transposase RayT